MGTFVVIVFIILIFFALLGKKKPVKQPSALSLDKLQSAKQLNEEMVQNILKNIKISVTTSSSTSKIKDNSIIDITGQEYKINSNLSFKKFNSGVPTWSHQYVYSHTEIYNATSQQKSFYNSFKNSFFNSEYLDLEGNSNYAFILLFDLLNDYENHKDILKLEKQFQALGHYYPKTKSYGISFLIQKMESKGDSAGVSRLRALSGYNYQGYTNDSDYWKLGSKYKAKLNLNEEEVQLLNKLWLPSNNFCNIEFCRIEILKLYVGTIAALKEEYINEGTKLETQFLTFADIVARKHFRYKSGSNNYKYCIDSTTTEIYSNIFKHCENYIREFYGHKRKINTDINYTTPEATIEFEGKIISKVVKILPNQIAKISKPNEDTEIELFSQNTNRWKIKFDEISIQYQEHPQKFVENILALGILNKKNPSVENIFFEASKFISKIDKKASLELYVHYLFHDLKSGTFDNKQLTKTIQKSLFKTNEQLHDFEIVVSELVKNKNLEKALQGVAKIYSVKRKRIKLDTASINEVQQQHSGTVELLNEYLQDVYEDENNSIKTQEINSEEVQIDIIQKQKGIHKSIYTDTLTLKPIHIIALELFAKCNFSVTQGDMETFAKSNGVFMNQLIESLNAVCYETLDDILIEEEEEFYTINPNYYQRLLAK